jgi:hypothetical protein
VPVTSVTPTTSVTPGGVPEPSADAVPAPPAGEVIAGHGSGTTAAAPQAGWDSPPLPPTVAGSRGSEDAPSLARDEAWARGPVRDGIVATATVALLGLLLLLGAVVGRRARRGGA